VEHLRLLVVMMYYTRSTYQLLVRNPQRRLDRVKEKSGAIEALAQGWPTVTSPRRLRTGDSPSDRRVAGRMGRCTADSAGR